ncbi:MAG: hypothetical protein EXS05_13365 [Planctomycetaceae bacterium]|nr:hypothetical protein [Planctomycetaceae bacterium]
MTGDALHWRICDPGPDRKLGTDDDLNLSPPLHLPSNIQARIILHSRDYIYTFELPEQHLKEIAVPEQTYVMEFNSGRPRVAAFRGDQFCGYSHHALSGNMVVEKWPDYRRWQREARRTGR